jgi:hypothetical protein
MQPITKALAARYGRENWTQEEASTETVTSHAPTIRGAEVLHCMWWSACKSHRILPYQSNVPNNGRIRLNMEAETAEGFGGFEHAGMSMREWLRTN